MNFNKTKFISLIATWTGTIGLSAYAFQVTDVPTVTVAILAYVLSLVFTFNALQK